jgi:hypothetical protein
VIVELSLGEEEDLADYILENLRLKTTLKTGLAVQRVNHGCLAGLGKCSGSSAEMSKFT